MPTKSTLTPEKLYECEVKRRRLRASGSGFEPFWKVKTIADAIMDGDTEFRCKDCHGAVKLHKRNMAAGMTLHVEHRVRMDSEYCALGAHFQNATDGRATRLSSAPVV
ncbi:MAG: hypothetical protein PW792_00475 [Acidobacteriaceae bacterium]|nr:hypothetical protein [Acidobacteriaceae bacterium]